MKSTFVIVTAVFALVSVGSAQGKKSTLSSQSLIRQYEQAEVDALIKGDIDPIRAHWAADYVVNNPFNVVVTASEGPIRAGTLTYSAFERNIERIVDHGNIMIVMGNEKVVPKAPSADAGKTINRRFTNIWLKRDGRWLLTARHANVICLN